MTNINKININKIIEGIKEQRLPYNSEFEKGKKELSILIKKEEERREALWRKIQEIYEEDDIF